MSGGTVAASGSEEETRRVGNQEKRGRALDRLARVLATGSPLAVALGYEIDGDVTAQVQTKRLER